MASRFVCLHLMFTIFFVLNVLSRVVKSEMCRKIIASQGEPQVFDCPRLFESKRKSFCCLKDTLHTTCCEYGQRYEHTDATYSSAILLCIFAALVFVSSCVLLTCRYCVRIEHFVHPDDDCVFSTFNVSPSIGARISAQRNASQIGSAPGLELSNDPPPSYDEIYEQPPPSVEEHQLLSVCYKSGDQPKEVSINIDKSAPNTTQTMPTKEN